MRTRKLALLLVVVGVLALPAPLYLSWAAEATAPPPRTSQVYAADPVDPTNETGRELLVRRHDYEVALSTHQVSEAFSAGEYRAPNATRRTLETAMRTGSATTDDPAAMADLRGVARNYTFVHDAYTERHRYYRLHVGENGSAVRAENASLAAVANVTVERVAVRYGSLTRGERRTVDRILANSSAGEYGYRPRVDDPFVDRLPGLVRKGGTLYSISARGHVDDFGSGFGAFFLGLAVSAVGVVLAAVGGIVYTVTEPDGEGG